MDHSNLDDGQVHIVTPELGSMALYAATQASPGRRLTFSFSEAYGGTAGVVPVVQKHGDEVSLWYTPISGLSLDLAGELFEHLVTGRASQSSRPPEPQKQVETPEWTPRASGGKVEKPWVPPELA